MLRKAVRVLDQSVNAVSTSTLSSSASNLEVLQELRRILDSPEFAGSERGKTLLTYLVENALSGGLERLKERTIGVEIFGRDAAYDTGQDAIVRVSANSIRKRLASYYARLQAAGEFRTLRIYLAPGSYTPEFLIEPAVGPLEPVSLAGAAPSADKRIRWYPILVGLLTVGCIILGVQNWQLRSEPAASVPFRVMPWSMLAGATEARIAMTDANFTMHKFISRREMTLSEYTSERWLWDFRPPTPSMIPMAYTAYTSVASALTAAKISALMERAGCSPLVGSARNLQLRDFKEDRPIILLGSAPSNPWVELFDERLNFVVDVDLDKKVQRCRNKAPRAGEEPFYYAVEPGGNPGVAYAVIASTPNLAGKAPVMIIAGTNAEATEAAGELATDLPRLRRELRKLGVDPEGKVAQFELLIRVRHLNQAPSQSDVIAHRISH